MSRELRRAENAKPRRYGALRLAMLRLTNGAKDAAEAAAEGGRRELGEIRAIYRRFSAESRKIGEKRCDTGVFGYCDP